MMLQKIWLYLTVGFLAMVLSAANICATELLQNGNFSAGTQNWHISSNIAPNWDPFVDSTGNPLTSGVISLSPGDNSGGYGSFTPPYYGTVIFQELNVTGIANQTITLGYNIYNNGGPSEGNTILPKIIWLDSSGVEHNTTLGAVPDNTVSGNAVPAILVSDSFTFPADAARLIRFKFSKNYTAQMVADNATLDIPSATLSPIPTITSLTPTTPLSYGDSLSITGTDFGASQGTSRVLIDNKTTGITVNSWSDTSINITVNDPVIGGNLKIEVDGVQSNRQDIAITSPFFFLTGDIGQTKLIQGEKSIVTVGVRTANGYTFPGSGITLSLVDPSGATPPSHTFGPATLLNEGGSMLTVDTSTLAAGWHEFEIHASDGSHGDQIIIGGPRIITVDSTRSSFIDTSSTLPTTITNLTVNRQGKFGININPKEFDNDGNPLGMDVPTTIDSSDTTVVLAISDQWGGPTLYARTNGSAIMTVRHPDNSTMTLPVTVSFPTGATDPVVTVVLSPSTVDNKYAGTFNFSANGSIALSSFGSSGTSGFTPANDLRSWSNSNQTYSGTFQLDLTTPPPTETTLLYSTIAGGSSGASSILAADYVPLTITNAPSYSAANGWVKSLDPDLATQMVESFTLEFYNADDTKAFSRDYFAMYTQGYFHLTAIEPGTYKVRCVINSGTSDEKSQWYPNSSTSTGAQSITFTAGNTQNEINFFFFSRYSDITGTISDPVGTAGGQVYPGITIELSNPATGVQIQSTTDANGNYKFQHIAEGSYTVQAATGTLTGNQHLNPPMPTINLSGANTIQNFEMLNSTSTVSLTSTTQNGHLRVTVDFSRLTAGGNDTYTLPRIADLTLQYDGALLNYQSATIGQALIDASKDLSPSGPTASNYQTGWQEMRFLMTNIANTNRIAPGELFTIDFLITGGGDTSLQFEPIYSNFAPAEANAVLEMPGLSLHISNSSMNFTGSLVLTDATGPAMGTTGALAYKVSAINDGSGISTGGICNAESTTTLTDCTNYTLEFGNLSLSYFEPTNGGAGDKRVYSYGTGAVKDGSGTTLFQVTDLNITMEVTYNPSGITGSGLALIDPTTPATSLLRDELSGPGGQIAFTFTSFNPVVQGIFGTYDIAVTLKPADQPMPNISFNNQPYTQSEDGGSQQVTLSLSTIPDRVVQVDIITVDGTAVAGSDYTNSTNTITWQAGDSQLSKSFGVPIISDNVAEQSETYSLSIINLANALPYPSDNATATITETATTTTISGIVTSSALGYSSGINGATVTVEDAAGGTWSTITNTNDGAWKIANLTNGLYTVTIEAPGHESVVIQNQNLSGGNMQITQPSDLVFTTPVTPVNPWDINGNGVLDTGDIIGLLGYLTQSTP